MNVRLAGDIVPSEVLLELKPIITSAVGWLVRTIVNVAVPPASVVVKPDVGFTVIPAVSSSSFITVISSALIPA